MAKLTISILQWSRLPWLDACLKSLYNEVQGLPIEVRILDDGIRNVSPVGGASETDTKNIVNKYGFEYYRRKENEPFGINDQIIRASKMSNGEYSWIIGNDDLFLKDSVKCVLDHLNDLNYYYGNYKIWKSDNPPNNPNEINSNQYGSKHIGNYPVDKISEFLKYDCNYFTPTYCSIMKTEHWLKAYNNYKDSRNKWIILEETIPYAIYITDNLMDKQGFYIGQHLLLCSYSVTWNKEPNAGNWANLFPVFCDRIKHHL